MEYIIAPLFLRAAIIIRQADLAENFDGRKESEMKPGLFCVRCRSQSITGNVIFIGDTLSGGQCDYCSGTRFGICQVQLVQEGLNQCWDRTEAEIFRLMALLRAEVFKPGMDILNRFNPPKVKEADDDE